MTYLKEIFKYDLEEGYTLARAENQVFSKYYGIYYINNSFEKSYDNVCSIIDRDDNCFWIIKDGKKIGGVIIEPNYIEGLFLIPPCLDEGIILKKLKKVLVEWSDISKPIEASVVNLHQIEFYKSIGFVRVESGRWMIRPTELFDITWENDFYVCSPNKENELEMGKVLYEAFENNEGLNFNYSLEEYTSWVKEYFDDNLGKGILNKASTLVYDKHTKELVGLCYISIWKEWPLISQIAVKPGYSGRGIGTNMIKKALTVLNEEYSAIRLYVDIGNNAEDLYYKLGFLKGSELINMQLI
ncbi:GNAT family N-acetyltransferase [Clostridium senegalense]|uniref:GNAT family N-acetyltransferase n=1 Tax=Clostridium senegalense TaxID=1465809 RepID=UPI001C116E1C|nr:GNAT family N-acetyltransferase [Clostridium senegalense]MBU5227244.1 GNAT family N-acetyltransferase [Clostridium senegalense]